MYKQEDYLQHYGVQGQKWGVRRRQNRDGSLTSQGKARYNKPYNKSRPYNKRKKNYNKKRRYNQSNKNNYKSNPQYKKGQRQKSYARRQKLQEYGSGFIATVAGGIIVAGVVQGSKKALSAFVESGVSDFLVTTFKKKG